MLEGSFVAIVTPFSNGEIDEGTFRNLIRRQIENGTDWIVPCGTTGESPTLSMEEHKKVVEIAIEESKGKAKVLAGAGSNSTREATILSQHAQEAGADAILVITPYYNKPTQEGLYKHFEAVAAKADIPMVLYNVPGRTGINLSVDTIIELDKIDSIQAIKEATGVVTRVSEIVLNTNIAVISGDDALTYPMMTVGAKGAISVTANVAPRLQADMIHKALAGDYTGARAIHDKLFGLNQKLFLETNPTPTKSALAMMGLIKNELRLPLCPMTQANEAILKAELQTLDLL